MEITLKNEQAQFEALKKRCTDITEQCKKIVITDETTKRIAIQNLSLLKAEMKIVVDVHKIAKEPYLKPCQALDKLKNALHDPMEIVFNEKNKAILAFDKKEREAAAAKTKAIQDTKNAIAKYSNDAIAKMDACKTYEELKAVRTEWIVNAPKDKWGEFLPQFDASILTLNEYAKSRKVGFLTPEQSDSEEVLAIAEVITAENENIGVAEIAATFVPKLSGSRKTWTHELIDITKVPAEWLMLNDANVKKWMAENKNKLVDDKELEFQGVKFFQRESLTIR